MTEQQPNEQRDAAELVTNTGKHPAIVVKGPTTAQTIVGAIVDLTALVGLVLLIAFDKLTPAEGLPWMAVLLGANVAGGKYRKNGPPAGRSSAMLALLGL
jgi:hypothetical protein